jgi:hypothetical protein
MDESGEQCTVVFALIATEPASGRWGVAIPSPLPTHTHSPAGGCVTIYAKTTVHCSPGSSMKINHYNWPLFLLFFQNKYSLCACTVSGGARACSVSTVTSTRARTDTIPAPSRHTRRGRHLYSSSKHFPLLNFLTQNSPKLILVSHFFTFSLCGGRSSGCHSV